MIKLHTQQGDCIMAVVTEIPKEAKRIKLSKELIVLKGEGVNTHTITETENIEAYELDGVMYLKVNKPTVIRHEEHGQTELEPNKIYKRIIEREFNYEQMEARNTQD